MYEKIHDFHIYHRPNHGDWNAALPQCKASDGNAGRDFSKFWRMRSNQIHVASMMSMIRLSWIKLTKIFKSVFYTFSSGPPTVSDLASQPARLFLNTSNGAEFARQALANDPAGDASAS